MDTVSKVVVAVSLMYVVYMLVQFAREFATEYKEKLEAKINAEADRLHK